jgi:F-type H+-transporting ATPase subunit b
LLEIESLIGLLLTAASGAGPDPFNWEFVGKHTANLAILVFVLVYFLKTPVKNFLMERRGQIAKKIESSEKEITEAKGVFDEYMEKMNNLGKEIDDLKESIKNEAEIERQEIIKQAEVSAKKIREDAQQTIKSETAKAKHEIQNEVVDLALQLAENLIKSNLNETDSKRIVEEFVKEVNETKWQQ